MTKAGTVNEWQDEQLRRDPALARRVEALVDEMSIEQDLIALREERGLSQRQLAELVGVKQPVIAKIESGTVKNLTLKTLLKITSALGARLRITIEKTEAKRRPAAAKNGRKRAAVP